MGSSGAECWRWSYNGRPGSVAGWQGAWVETGAARAGFPGTKTCLHVKGLVKMRRSLSRYALPSCQQGHPRGDGPSGAPVVAHGGSVWGDLRARVQVRHRNLHREGSWVWRLESMAWQGMRRAAGKGKRKPIALMH